MDGDRNDPSAKTGCETCAVASFPNQTALLEHKFSLPHHVKVDQHFSSNWFHICELCRVKAGPLQNFVDHLEGRKHKRELEMFRQKHKQKGNSKTPGATPKATKKKNVNGKAPQKQKTQKQPKAQPKRTRPARNKPPEDPPESQGRSSRCSADDRNSEPIQRKTDRRSKSGHRDSPKDQPGSWAEESEADRSQRSNPGDASAGCAGDERGDMSFGSDGSMENFDWHRSPPPPLPIPPLPIPPHYTQRGYRVPADQEGYRWRPSGPPPYNPYASRSRDFDRYPHHPLPRGRGRISRWQQSDGGGYDNYHSFNNGSGRPPPWMNDHAPYEWSQEPAGNHESSRTNTRGQDAPAKVPSAPRSKPGPNPSAPSDPPPAREPAGKKISATEGWLSEPYAGRKTSAKEDGGGKVPNAAATAKSSSALTKTNEKPKAAGTSGQVAQTTSKPAEKPSASPKASPSLIPASKPVPSPKATPTSKPVPATKSAPASKLPQAPKLAAASKPDAMKSVKKEPAPLQTQEPVIQAPAADRNHHIFVSSDEDESADAAATVPKKKPKAAGGTKATGTSDAASTAPKPKKRAAGEAKTVPNTPERASSSLPKQALLCKSPKGVAVSTKDVYRKDVLDKLVNFPSSRKVQTQLTKWMMDLRKTQKATPSRANSLRLCTTRKLLGQSSEDEAGMIVGEIDYDALLQQVQVGDLPEEMLRSLRIALSSDTEQAAASDDTHSFLSDDECVVVPAPEKKVVSVDLVADSDRDTGTEDEAVAAATTLKPDPGTPQGARGRREEPAAPKADETTTSKRANTDASDSRQVKPARRKDRQAGQQSSKEGEAEQVVSSSAAAQVPSAQPQAQPPPRSKTSTPQGTSRPPSASGDGQQQTTSKQATPLLSSSASAKVPSPLPASAAPPPVVLKEEPGVASANQSGSTPPLKGLVDELVQLCHEEDHIRSQMAAVEQNIASVTLALEDLKRKRDELQARESQVRKARLEKLECLQGVASLPGGQPLPFMGHAQTFPTTSEVLASFGSSSDAFNFLLTSSSPAAPTVTSTQGGLGYLGGLGGSPNVMQQLFPHLQPMGAGPGGPFGDAEGLGTAPGAVPVTSSKCASKRAASKRKPTKAGDSPAARKKTKPGKSDTEGDLDDARLDEIISGQEITAHDGAIVALKLHKHYVFSSSTDNTAKRFDLLDPSQCVVYNGSTRTVNSLEVQCPKKLPTLLYTASLDGFLRCFEADSGECVQEHNIEIPIVCTTLCWGKIYLGLQTGYVAVFNLKSQKVQDTFYCSNCAVSRIATTTEGSQKLLCTVTNDGSVTVRDPSTGLLFRCLDGLVQPPSCIAVNNGSVYTTSADRTIHVHELRTGSLLKVYEAKSAATGVRFYKNLLVCCSFDGLIRCYKTKDFSCQVMYYGAGKNMVMSMDVSGPLIATGNRKGKIEVVNFNKSNLQVCEVRSCNLKFAREEDLVHHLKREHIGVGAKGSMTCPWTQCQMSFSGPNCNKDFEKHLMDHAYT